MKALTVRQPHAQLIALGVKTIETRTKPTKYRGPLLIHAGKQPPETGARPGGWQVDSYGQPHQWQMWKNGWRDGQIRTDTVVLPLGAVVASCKLVDCVAIMDHFEANDGRAVVNHGDGLDYCEAGNPGPSIDRPDVVVVNLEQERADYSQSFGISDITDQLPYGDFTPGRFAWLLEDIKPTTERCPACWGIGRVEGPLHLDAADIWDCPKCDGKGNCDPIPAKGKLGFWNWEP